MCTLLLTLVATAAASASSSSIVSVQQGKVEHLIAPLGIGTLAPRFSWTLSVTDSSRNVSQTSYRLRVGSTPALGNTNLHCDSGVVSSDANFVPLCAAQPLDPARVYWWSVTLTTGGRGTATMPPQRFSTGLQTAADWHDSAKFIGHPALDSSGLCPWVRSASFTVDPSEIAQIAQGAASSLLSVASIGWHEAYLNGHKLENSSTLIPSISDLHHRVLSHQYDAGSLLRPGENVIAFWLAPGWSSLTWPNAHKVGQPGSYNNAGTSFNVTKTPLVMAQLSVCSQLVGQTCKLLASTSGIGWKSRSSTTTHIGGWQWADYGGEQIDHRAALANWFTTSPTTGWAAAAVFEVDKQVTPESLEPMQISETIQASGIAPCTNHTPLEGCFVVSFPKLFNGFWDISSLPIGPGANLSFTYSANCLAPCANVTQYMPCNPPTSGSSVCTSIASEWNAVDTMVTTASHTGFTNRFNWHTFQFVKIKSSNNNFTLSSSVLANIAGKRIRNNQQRVGSFVSSSPLLNQIYAAFMNTYEGLTVSGMQVDCTNRERLGYGGDAHSRIEYAMDSYDSHALYTKWLTDWRDAQMVGANDDKQPADGVFGNVPNTAPTFSGAGGPMWGGIVVLLPYELYRRFGDLRMLKASYPAIQGFLDFMIHFSMNRTDGMCHADGFDWLGDWQAPHGCS